MLVNTEMKLYLTRNYLYQNGKKKRPILPCWLLRLWLTELEKRFRRGVLHPFHDKPRKAEVDVSIAADLRSLQSSLET